MGCLLTLLLLQNPAALASGWPFTFIFKNGARLDFADTIDHLIFTAHTGEKRKLELKAAIPPASKVQSARIRLFETTHLPIGEEASFGCHGYVRKNFLYWEKAGTVFVSDRLRNATPITSRTLLITEHTKQSPSTTLVTEGGFLTIDQTGQAEWRPFEASSLSKRIYNWEQMLQSGRLPFDLHRGRSHPFWSSEMNVVSTVLAEAEGTTAASVVQGVDRTGTTTTQLITRRMEPNKDQNDFKLRIHVIDPKPEVNDISAFAVATNTSNKVVLLGTIDGTRWIDKEALATAWSTFQKLQSSAASLNDFLGWFEQTNEVDSRPLSTCHAITNIEQSINMTPLGKDISSLNWEMSRHGMPAHGSNGPNKAQSTSGLQRQMAWEELSRKMN